ncbi:hypothetical protein ABZP36_012601 [Zizania latifolia]
MGLELSPGPLFRCSSNSIGGFHLSSALANVGFIGFGNMDAHTARNLVMVGYKVTVHDINFIGEGGFGPIYKGFVDDKLRPDLQPMHVAVKYLDTDGPQGHREWLVSTRFLSASPLIF